MSTKTRKEGGILFLLAFGHERSRTPPSTRANAHERASLSRSTTSATPRDEPIYEINKYAPRERKRCEYFFPLFIYMCLLDRAQLSLSNYLKRE